MPPTQARKENKESSAEQDARFIEMLRNSGESSPVNDDSDQLRKKLAALLDRI